MWKPDLDHRDWWLLKIYGGAGVAALTIGGGFFAFIWAHWSF